MPLGMSLSEEKQTEGKKGKKEQPGEGKGGRGTGDVEKWGWCTGKYYYLGK